MRKSKNTNHANNTKKSTGSRQEEKEIVQEYMGTGERHGGGDCGGKSGNVVDLG